MDKNSSSLIDKYGRVFRYLRLSITDVCNFRCCYCLPFGYRKSKNYGNFLSLDEIRVLLDVFCSLGLEKVRLSGGEPTLRKDFFLIGKLIASFKNISVLAFTTNGYKLKEIAERSRYSGFTNVNISIDSLISSNFFSITGRDLLSNVLNGVYKSIAVGLCVKVNVVLLCGFSIYDFDNFLDFVLYENISIRFIELVGTKNSINFFLNNFISSLFLRNYLENHGWIKCFFERNAGPAVVYSHRYYAGTIGFISSYSSNFCLFCNRLRISAVGDFYLCLFGGKEKIYTIREYLSFDKRDVLKNVLQNIISYKDLSHFLLAGDFGAITQLSQLGG